jgi:hypothetical protein
MALHGILDELISVHLRHVEIDKNKRYLSGFQDLDPSLAIPRRQDFIVPQAPGKPYNNYIEQVFVIIDKKNCFFHVLRP